MTVRPGSGSERPSGDAGDGLDVAELIREGVHRAREQVRTETAGLPPWVRVLHGLTLASMVSAVVLLFYGFLKFPHAPIRTRQSASGLIEYVGKGDRPQSKEHYVRFKDWERKVPAAFGLAFALGIGSAWADARRKPRGPR